MVAIFLVGVGLRAWHLGSFPAPNATADEYAWTWSGMTLVGQGRPRAWSWLPGYPTTPLTEWRGHQYRIVSPWLDHPPLYPIYVGAFMRAAGVRDPFAVELGTARLSTLLLYAAAFWLFWLVARRVADAPTALLALALWAVAPPAVWNGRLVMAEQLVLPEALFGLWALFAYVDTRRRGWLVAVGVAAALLPLTKAAALGFVLTLFTVAVVRRERALVAAVCAGAAVGLALWAGYGAHYGWALFRAILDAQARRFRNFGGFDALVFNPRVVTKPFMYLPFLLGFYALIADLRDGRHVELGWLAVTYAAAIAFFLPWNDNGWYLIPLYPALAFGVASFVVRALGDVAVNAGWIWISFSVVYLCWIACDAELGPPTLWRWSYLGALVALPFSTWLAARRPRAWRLGFGALVALQLACDAAYALGK